MLALTSLLVVAASAIGCSGFSSDTGGLSDDRGGAANSSVPPVAPLDQNVTFQPKYASANGLSSYKIGPSDVLQVTVFQVDELNRKVQVGGNGSISLPLIGLVNASGRTAQDIAADIAGRLRARFLQSPQVTVYIEEYNSQKVTVGGSVKKPGILPLKGDLSLLQALAAAEGLDAVADTTSVVVFRQKGSDRFVGRFNIDQIRAGSAQDPLLENGDVVMVDSSGLKTTLRDWSPVLSGIGSTAGFVSVLK